MSATPDILLEELSSIERTMAATAALLEQYGRRSADLYAQLDIITKPDEPVRPVAPPRRRYLSAGFRFDDKWTASWCALDVYRGMLRRLWVDLPEKRHEMASAMQAYGRVCRYIDQDRHALFVDKPAHWIVKHSELLCDGWFIDTLLTPDRIRKLLIAAVRAAGLRPGVDVEFRVRGTWQTSPNQG